MRGVGAVGGAPARRAGRRRRPRCGAAAHAGAARVGRPAAARRSAPTRRAPPRAPSSPPSSGHHLAGADEITSPIAISVDRHLLAAAADAPVRRPSARARAGRSARAGRGAAALASSALPPESISAITAPARYWPSGERARHRDQRDRVDADVARGAACAATDTVSGTSISATVAAQTASPAVGAPARCSEPAGRDQCQRDQRQQPGAPVGGEHGVRHGAPA